MKSFANYWHISVLSNGAMAQWGGEFLKNYHRQFVKGCRHVGAIGHKGVFIWRFLNLSSTTTLAFIIPSKSSKKINKIRHKVKGEGKDYATSRARNRETQDICS
jgi:hypothetical protein